MRAAILALLCLLPQPAFAQGAGATPPNLLNGRLDTQAAGNLAATFQRLVAAQTEPGWIGYSVPTLTRSGGESRLCCGGDYWMSDGVVISNGRLATCGLEPGNRAPRPENQPPTVASPVRLEGPDTMVVLYRVEEKTVQKVRIFSPDCELDAGGRAVHWLDGVAPADSVKLLSSLLSGTDRLRGGAMPALALHREEVALPVLLTLAKQDQSTKVRGDALFWLAETAGRRVVPEITSAIENDPDTEVKKRAVFALSQLPKDEGIPLLINLARTHKNPVVRKQAMFWLGQSRDPRALDFFTQVLTK